MNMVQTHSLSKIRCGIACVLAVFLLLLAPLAGAESAGSGSGGIEISTAYPAATLKAGDSLSFKLNVENQSGASRDIVLDIVSIPEGWEGAFTAEKRQVSIVHVKHEETNENVAFEVTVPLEAEDGEYAIRLKADAGAGISDTMDIRITVNAEEIGSSSFAAEYPSQEGAADTSFSFDATLVNNTLSEQSYSFSSNAPSGWQVSFKPSGETTKVASITVEPRKSQGIKIDVKPPENVKAGVYEINCTAASATEKMAADLSVTITDTYELQLSTPSGLLSLDAYANKETAVQLTLSNLGNSDLANVNLSSTAPTGWTIRFEPSTVERIEAGAAVEATAYFLPSKDALSGDYAATLTARNTNTSARENFRITVKTETKWGFAGLGIIALLAVCLAVIFRKYGRR